ncbi:MAG: hypothetical protein WBB94_00775 [Candidatus Saccharimonadaceae bacterium]
MDLLKSSKHRSRISEALYIGLNLGLAIALLLIVLAVDSPVFAIALVLLSKWRIMAVRPRYWFANLMANLVDIIVSLSVVFLLYAAQSDIYLPKGQTGLYIQIALTVLYAVWLLFVKPRSKRSIVALQAGTALFLGVTSAMMMAYAWDSVFTVALLWLVGYSSARHMLTAYEEEMTGTLSLIWGFVVAEIGWLMNHWTFAYSVPGFGGLKLVQFAIVISLIGFVAEKAFVSYSEYGQIRSADILLPALLAFSIIFLLVIFFNYYGVLGGGTV